MGLSDEGMICLNGRPWPQLHSPRGFARYHRLALNGSNRGFLMHALGQSWQRFSYEKYQLDILSGMFSSDAGHHNMFNIMDMKGAGEEICLTF